MSGVAYLCVGGNEVANGNRALSYARAIGDPRVDVALRVPLIAETGGPVPENLVGFCEAIEEDDRPANEVTYLGPVADPAPWYSAERDDSAEFLGLHLSEMRSGPVIGRSLSQRERLGADLSPLRRGGRVLSCAGTMFASTERGMRYGERWLTDVLSGTDCDRGDDTVLLLACDAATLRTLPWAGVIDGPVFAPVASDVPDCLLQTVSFQFGSPLPWLLAEPEILAEDTAPTTVSALVTGPEWTGDVAVAVTIVSGGPDPVTDIAVSAAYPVAGECPTARAPYAAFTVPSLPPNRTLVIDAVRRDVTAIETSTGRVIGGLDLLDFDGMWRWVEVGACTTACVAVEFGAVNANTTVEMSSVRREL